MGDSKRDFEPEPVRKCRECGGEFTPRDWWQWVCNRCYREMMDEAEEMEVEGGDEWIRK